MQSKRTTLRRIEHSDLEDIHVLESDVSIMRFTSLGAAQSKEQTERRLQEHLARQAELEPFGRWVAHSKEDRSFVGWFMLLRGKKEDELELGYMLSKAHWGKGLATEIGNELVNFVRSKAEIAKIVATTNTDNLGSIRVLEKIGFAYIGTIEEHASTGGEPLRNFELIL